MLESTKAALLQRWNDQDIHYTVLASLMVQIFLLFTGKLRRRRINGFLRFVIWLAYVGADAVAVYAIGLFSQYEEKYKLKRYHSSGDHTLPFLWAPFVLLHLGGQDTITAFAMEDNNLWLRHFLNLAVQVTLTLYVFWKSFQILESQLLVVAVLIFVAGIIKYGERTWALYSGSRDYLRSRRNEEGEEPLRDYRSSSRCGDVMATYALNTTLRVRGFLVGRTLFQLGKKIEKELVEDFAEHVHEEGKLQIVMMELGMMYDLLYTKAMVMQSWIGCIFRYIAEASMVVAFALFLADRRRDAYRRSDLAITYTLFVGALFMETCSVCMVIASPWTRAGSKKGTFRFWLSSSACSLPRAIMRRDTNLQEQRLSSFSLGQLNLADYSLGEKCTGRLISKVIGALGAEQRWRNLWHIKYIEDKKIGDYIERLLCSGEGSQQLELGRELNYMLSLPFEHAVFRLHIFTDLHLRKMSLDEDEIGVDCRKLSNYLMYLMAVYPCMLPVSNAAQDLEYSFVQWVRDNHNGIMTKPDLLSKYADECLRTNDWNLEKSPFDLTDSTHSPELLLKAMKEVWVRLLIYAAGKCPAEVHARQFGSGNGVELLSCVWLLMVHRGFGDVGRREVKLLSRRAPYVPDDLENMVLVNQECTIQPRHGPLYVFHFHEYQLQREQEIPTLFVAAWDLMQPTEPASLCAFPVHTTPDAWQAGGSTSAETLQQDTSHETDVASGMAQNQAHVVLEIEQDLGATPETEQAGAGYVALEIEQAGYVAVDIDRGEPGN